MAIAMPIVMLIVLCPRSYSDPPPRKNVHIFSLINASVPALSHLRTHSCPLPSVIPESLVAVLEPVPIVRTRYTRSKGMYASEFF